MDGTNNLRLFFFRINAPEIQHNNLVSEKFGIHKIRSRDEEYTETQSIRYRRKRKTTYTRSSLIASVADDTSCSERGNH